MTAEQRAALDDAISALNDAAESISGEWGRGLPLAVILDDVDEHGNRQAVSAARLSAAFADEPTEPTREQIDELVVRVLYASTASQFVNDLTEGVRALFSHPSPSTPSAEPVRIEEPSHRGNRVRDRQGDIWRRGNKGWWHWERPVYGEGAAGKLQWSELVRQYGPVTNVTPPPALPEDGR